MDFKGGEDNDPKAKIILREKTKKMVVDLIGKEDTKGTLNSREDMNNLVKEILDEALALGPLEDLLRDKECSEIMVIGQKKFIMKKAGKFVSPILSSLMIAKFSMSLKGLLRQLGEELMKKLLMLMPG